MERHQGRLLLSYVIITYIVVIFNTHVAVLIHDSDQRTGAKTKFVSL